MKVQFSYQTLLLPPPFAFAYTLAINLDKQQPYIELDFEYLNREEISEEEIISEGYSLETQFSWQGALDPHWKTHIEKQLEGLKLEEHNGDENTHLYARKEANKTSEEGYVADVEHWDYQLQELQQAIYEAAKIEAPLKMKIIEDNHEYLVEASFLSRAFTINGQKLAWEGLSGFLEKVYETPFEELEGKT